MIFDFKRPLELPSQLQWSYAHEPALMEWTIQARNYNTFVANIAYVFISLFMLIPSYAVYAHDRDFLSGGIFYILGMLFSSLMTHQRTKFAYRFTQSGVEYCKWKDFPQWALTFLNWFAGIAAVICVSLVSTDPTLLIGALIGPGGIGLVYLVKVNSKSYQAMQAEYHHHEIKWTEITRLAIASNREVVDLKYKAFEEGDPLPVIGNLNLFCRRGQKYEVAELIKPYMLKEADFMVARVNVPMSIY